MGDLNFQNKLRELRGVRKSQAEYAKELGISTSAYVMYETGKREPSKNFIKIIKKKYPEIDTNIFFK